MENYLVEMGKGALSGLMEYVSVGFYAILLPQLWFGIEKGWMQEEAIPCFQHPEKWENQPLLLIYNSRKMAVNLVQGIPFETSKKVALYSPPQKGKFEFCKFSKLVLRMISG